MKTWSTWIFVLVCALAALAPLAGGAPTAPLGSDGFPGWPSTFEGRALTRLPLTPIEIRFGQNFPGHVGRFSDGQRGIILRWVAQGTRKLHPGGDCFKANGFTLTPTPVTMIGAERWSGFIAVHGKQKLEVRERIVDAHGGQWSDMSAWYWAVQLGRTEGPWWAVTVAQHVQATR